MGRLLAWIGVALLATYLVFIGGGWFGIYSSELRVLTMILAGLTLLAWTIVSWRDPAWRPRSVLLPPILLALGSLAISTLFSRVPRVSLEYLGYSVVLAALYLLLVRLFASPFFRARLGTLAALLFAVIAGLFLALVIGHWVDWWTALGRLAVPPLRPDFESLAWGNPSAVMTMAVLLAAPAVATLGWDTTRRRMGVAIVIAATGIVTLLSGSRAGWLALGLTIVVAAIAWLAPAAHRSWLRSTPGRIGAQPAGRIGLGAAVLVAVAATIIVAPTVQRRASEGGEDLRATYASVALRIFSESPLVGTGPGTWVIQRIAFTQSPEVDYYIPHAHNVDVQTLAELGLVGAVVGLALIAALAWLIANALRDARPERRRWAAAAGVAMVYFGLHQQLDFYANMPAVLFAAAIPVAFLDATRAGASVPFRRWPDELGSRWLRATSVVVVGAAIVGLLAMELPALHQTEAVAAANEGHWAAALAPARAAAAADPDVTPYLLTAGLASSRAGDHAAAAADFERVANRDDLPEAWLDLAAEDADLGQPEAAIAALGRSLRLGDQRPAVAMPAGDLALRLGDADLATSAFAAALVAGPSLAADPWWAADPTRTALLRLAIATAEGLTTPDVRWELELMAGNPGRAAEIAASATDPALAVDVIGAWSGDAGAVDGLLQRCADHPLDAVALLWCARVEGHTGDRAAAERFRFLANTINGSAAGGAELRVSTRELVGRSLEGSPAYFWGTYTYRRPTPWDILVPSLVHLTLQ